MFPWIKSYLKIQSLAAAAIVFLGSAGWVHGETEARRTTPPTTSGQAYGTAGGERNLLDVWTPERPPGPKPAVIYFHGGGWKSGDKSKVYQHELFLREGIVFISANYRYSSDAPFPAQVEDALTAVRWVREHAKELGVDPERIGLMGSEAGGHIALVAALAANSGEFGGEQVPGIRAVVALGAPTDLALANGTRTQHLVTQLLGGPAPKKGDLVKRANPASHSDAKDPAVLLIYGDTEDTVPTTHGELLAEAITENGGTVELIRRPQSSRGSLVPENIAAALDFLSRNLTSSH